MNPFYDISEHKELPADALQLYNLGNERIFASIGKTTRDGWGSRSTEWSRHTTPVQPEDYDRQFVHKLTKSKPVYNMSNVLDYHFNYYCSTHPRGEEDFLKHMRYVALPALKKLKNQEVCIELFEQWLNQKVPQIPPRSHTVNNNTVNVGNINAPTQFQQNSAHSVQTQYNHYQKEDIQKVFELLKKDIENVDEKIRQDFAMEMDYAVTQLAKDKDIKPQLLNIGSIITQVGMGTFTNLLAAPIFELIKPYLGLS